MFIHQKDSKFILHSACHIFYGRLDLSSTCTSIKKLGFGQTISSFHNKASTKCVKENAKKIVSSKSFRDLQWAGILRVKKVKSNITYYFRAFIYNNSPTPTSPRRISSTRLIQNEMKLRLDGFYPFFSLISYHFQNEKLIHSQVLR